MDLKVIGINAGNGVSLYPFKEYLLANFEARGLFHTPKQEQWKVNFGNIPLYREFTELDVHQGIDLVISSPDCGSGSVFRLSRAKEFGNHKENKSLAMFFGGIEALQPKLFYFENLNGLFKSFPKKEFKAEVPNYRLVIHNESVSAWGNSQKSRKRLVIIGIRRDLPKKLRKCFKLPKEPQIQTCKQLYKDLEDLLPKESIALCHVSEPKNEVISIHARKRMSIQDIKDEWQGRLKGKKRWTVEGGNFSTAPGVYRNLLNDYPATARKANRQFDHNGDMMSPRQLARVQGVPDDFKLYMDVKRLNYWINKARTTVTKTPPMDISYWLLGRLKKCKKLWNHE